MLDVGTGSGVLAILAAQHSDQVTAIDVNPRALMFARFNARLNGVSHLQLLEGSWFEPVAGRTFDLIACNPPYVARRFCCPTASTSRNASGGVTAGSSHVPR
jgi:methylase of polypeptide subunit release factors